ncbi:hypothetical protein H8K90_07855 [Winogradskyella echinorum]|uniref:Uncharacterized protein n=1 Tax=Winogradskyella echinorum TaxID=538189 RepID=A0ABR6Y0V6_9FLAO|nr:hypothetical protein [Winogradskyella echinorum]MBC3846289.1 hypothetical protein [Winogradskyella echinorum]MBC5750637.1 hypothetical protein [Winogradskyella echinorum]
MEFRIIARSEDELMERIHEMKSFHAAAINYELFWQVMHNIGNGPTRRRVEDWKSQSLAEWIVFYEEYNITVNKIQLSLIFEYVNRYFTGILQANSQGHYKAIVRSNISEADNIFTLERISLNTLSI